MDVWINIYYVREWMIILIIRRVFVKYGVVGYVCLYQRPLFS